MHMLPLQTFQELMRSQLQSSADDRAAPPHPSSLPNQPPLMLNRQELPHGLRRLLASAPPHARGHSRQAAPEGNREDSSAHGRADSRLSNAASSFAASLASLMFDEALEQNVGQNLAQNLEAPSTSSAESVLSDSASGAPSVARELPAALARETSPELRRRPQQPRSSPRRQTAAPKSPPSAAPCPSSAKGSPVAPSRRSVRIESERTAEDKKRKGSVGRKQDMESTAPTSSPVTKRRRRQ